MPGHYVASVCSGLLAGALGAYAVNNFGQPTGGIGPAAAATMTQPGAVSAERIQLVDSAGRTRAVLAMSPDGGPGLFFYDTSGRNRLVLGLYGPAEGELPFVVLNDAQQRAAGILRLYGRRDTPVVVLKSDGRDRSIYGLNAGSTEPFLVNLSDEGKRTSVFGSF